MTIIIQSSTTSTNTTIPRSMMRRQIQSVSCGAGGITLAVSSRWVDMASCFSERSWQVSEDGGPMQAERCFDE